MKYFELVRSKGALIIYTIKGIMAYILIGLVVYKMVSTNSCSVKTSYKHMKEYCKDHINEKKCIRFR